jgi:putative Mg2+ transporter-C (MgtC) family protein
VGSLVYCTVVNVTLDLGNIVAHTVSLAIAYMLALPLGWDREQGMRSAGLRTFPLVAMASCGFIIIAQQVARESPEAQARIIEGVITGIGFIGGGAILKEGGSVRGTATAASLWNTGAIGAAVAYGYYEIAVVLSVMNFLTLRFLTPLGRSVRSKGDQSD